MVKKIALGLLVVGITPITELSALKSTATHKGIAIANSSPSVSLSDIPQFLDGHSQSIAASAPCGESTLCQTQTSDFELINSDFWLQEITTSLLPNALLITCEGASSYQNKLANNVLTKFLKSPLQTRSPSVSLSSFSKTVSSKCGFAPKQQLPSTASLKEQKSTSTIKQNAIPQKLVKTHFPKLSRSSLIVSFPKENSTFVPINKKLANPAPETKRIASPFGWRKRPYSNQRQFHQGIDYGAPYGSTVVAVGNGIVTRVVNGCADFGNLYCGGQLGNWIEIDHGKGTIGTYGHLKHSSIAVEEGMRVRKNQPIAQVGSSGWSTGAHLDFRFKVNGEYEDPAQHVMNIEKIKKDGVIFSEVD